MGVLLKHLKIIGIHLGIMFVLVLLISLFNTLGWLGSIPSAILNMLFGAIILFMLGINYGKRREKRGFVAGLEVGFIAVIIMFLISFLIFRIKLNLMMVIYYGILILASVMGAMLGINKKSA